MRKTLLCLTAFWTLEILGQSFDKTAVITNEHSRAHLKSEDLRFFPGTKTPSDRPKPAIVQWASDPQSLEPGITFEPTNGTALGSIRKAQTSDGRAGKKKDALAEMLEKFRRNQRICESLPVPIVIDWPISNRPPIKLGITNNDPTTPKNQLRLDPGARLNRHLEKSDG